MAYSMSDKQPSSPKEWQRFYMGYKERFVEDCEIKLSNGRTVRLKQAPSAKKRQGKGTSDLDKVSDPALTGTTVWDGAIVLAQYLTATDALSRAASSTSRSHFHPNRPDISTGESERNAVVDEHADRSCQGAANSGSSCGGLNSNTPALPLCLELGAGTGAVALSLLAAGSVRGALITDIPDMLPHLQQNVQHNGAVLNPCLAHVRCMRWSNADDIAALAPFKPPFDLIVGADLIYYSYTPATPHSRLLLQALQQLGGPKTLIYLALSLHHNPEEVHKFLAWAEEWGFAVHCIREGLPEGYLVPDVLVAQLRLVDATKASAMAKAAAAGTLKRQDEV